MASVANGDANSPDPKPTTEPKNEIFLSLRPIDKQKKLNLLTVFNSTKQCTDDCFGFIENEGFCLNVREPEDAQKLMELTELIDGTPISCEMHPHRNVIRRAVNVAGSCDLPDDEIQRELAEQGIIGVRRIRKTIGDGQKKNTEMLVLTYPRTIKKYKTVKFGFLKFSTFPYYPDVKQCFKCWEFRHIKPQCPNEQPICGTCSGPHETINKGKVCHKKSFCKKCQSSGHPISSRKCPKYEAERAISHIRINKDISHWKATWEYEAKHKGAIIECLNAKVATMEADLDRKDREIKVLRAIYEATKLNEAKAIRINQLQEPKPSKVVKTEAKPKTKESPKEKEVVVKGAEESTEQEQSGAIAGEGKARRKKKGKKGRGK